MTFPNRTACVGAALLLFPACTNITPKEWTEVSDDGHDTGVSPVVSTGINPGTIEVDMGAPAGVPGNCTAYVGSGRTVNLNGYALVSAAAHGWDRDLSDTNPGSLYPAGGTHSVKISRFGTECDGDGTTPYINGHDGDWTSDTVADTLDDCANPNSSTAGCRSSDSCSGDYKVDVTYSDTSISCFELDPVKTIFEVTGMENDDATSGDSSCGNGSGRFDLLPIGGRDFDKDGQFGLVMLPVMRSGSGVMTRKAWVTSITPYSMPSGPTLRVLKPSHTFGFDSSDALLNASTAAVTISGTTSISTGVVRGDPVFVASETAAADIGDYVVDMSWTCGATAHDHALAQGYMFSLDDIGCPGTQKFTLRYNSGKHTATLEEYGNPDFSVRSKTTNLIGGGASFEFTRGDFDFAGVIVSADEDEAEVNITSLSWQDDDICEPGTYTFAAAQ